MFELIAIRHGETEWNLEWRQQGHQDSRLTARGIDQARAVADALADDEFSALYSSDLGRAMTTANIIAEKTGHEVIPDQRLRERHLGIFQGLTMAESEEKYPEDYELYRSGGEDYRIPQGESKRQRTQRMLAAINEYVQRHPNQRVVVIGHAGLLDSLICHTLGLSLAAPRRYKLPNAAINTFFVRKNIWLLGSWGETAHLRTPRSRDKVA